MSQRHISAKRAWARLEERAVLGEKFGWIACAERLLEDGMLTRAQVVDLMNVGRITASDLDKFERQTDGRSGIPRSGRSDRGGQLVVATEAERA